MASPAAEFSAGDETLEDLLVASRAPEGRRRLAGTGVVAFAISHLDLSSTSLLLLLRLLRNLCAGEILNLDSFLASDGVNAVAAVILASESPDPEIIRAGLQVFCNFVLAGKKKHRDAVWERMFPEGFLRIAKFRDIGISDPLCMVIDTCSVYDEDGGTRTLDELCGDAGILLLLEIITTGSQVGYKEEWLEWLLFKVCVEERKLNAVFSGLNSSTCEQAISMPFNTKQSFLLRVLSKCLSERPTEVTVTCDFALNMLEVLRKSCEAVDFTTRSTGPLPTGNPQVDVLGYSLLILRDACAWDPPVLPAKEVPVQVLLDAGLLELVLTLLGALEAPAIVRKAVHQAQATVPSTSRSPSVCPYAGYRRDLVSIIANCIRGTREVQDKVRQLNGIILVLQQCVVDEENPLLREWGILAVKNLLEGNEDNQNEVAQLEMQEPVTTPAIADLGLRVEVDKEKRRAKLVNM